jgi:hypothetical protein
LESSNTPTSETAEELSAVLHCLDLRVLLYKSIDIIFENILGNG